MTIPSLQKIVFSHVVPRFFEDPKEPEEACFGPVLQNIYRKICIRPDQNKRIKEICDRAINELTEDLLTVWKDPSKIGEIRDKLSCNGSFGNRWVFEFYQEGVTIFDRYVSTFEEAKSEQEMKDLKAFCDHWLDTIKNDFASGEPLSFPHMAEWVECWKLADLRLLSQNPPPIHWDRHLSLLKKLAYLGVAEAQEALGRAYGYIRMDDQRCPGLHHEEKMKALKTLLSWGVDHQMLASLYNHNSLGYLYSLFSDSERKEEMHRLIELNAKTKNDWVSQHFITGKIGHLECEHPLEKRIDFLTVCAQEGDQQALQALWEFYATNHLSKEKHSVELTEKERWKRLFDLKTENNEQTFQLCYISWMISPTKYLPCRLTILERFAYIEKKILEKEISDRDHIDFLADCYRTNHWEMSAPLNICFPDRLRNLERLVVQSQSKVALEVLATFWIARLCFRMPDRRMEDIPNVEQEVRYQSPLKDRVDRLISLTICARHFHLLDELIYEFSELRYNELISIVRLAERHFMAIKERGDEKTYLGI